MDRRGVLRAAGAGALVGLAGCTGDRTLGGGAGGNDQTPRSTAAPRPLPESVPLPAGLARTDVEPYVEVDLHRLRRTHDTVLSAYPGFSFARSDTTLLYEAGASIDGGSVNGALRTGETARDAVVAGPDEYLRRVYGAQFVRDPAPTEVVYDGPTGRFRRDVESEAVASEPTSEAERRERIAAFRGADVPFRTGDVTEAVENDVGVTVKTYHEAESGERFSGGLTVTTEGLIVRAGLYRVFEPRSDGSVRQDIHSVRWKKITADGGSLRPDWATSESA